MNSYAGDEYVEGLHVALSNGEAILRMRGSAFERLMMALEMRTYAFDAKTREFKADSLPSDVVEGALRRHVEDVEVFGVVPEAVALGELVRGGHRISWWLDA